MRTRNLSYPAVADRFVAGLEGYSHCPRHRNPRMYTDGKTIWSYGEHFPIARHEGIWYMPSGPVKIISRTSCSYSSTTNRQISIVHRKIIQSATPELRVLEMRYEIKHYDLKEGCEYICQNAVSKITRLMLSYSRCSRDWSKRSTLYWVQCALHQLEAAQWILGKRTEVNRISMPEYLESSLPPWDLLMSLADFISPHLNLYLNLSLKLPSLYKRVKLNCRQKVWGTTGSSPKKGSSKNVGTPQTNTIAPSAGTGKSDNPPSIS
jgi:hypothetical protein